MPTRPRTTGPRRRSIAERVALRLPAVTNFAIGHVSRLPVGSRFRRRMLKRWLSRGFDASSRNDVDVVLLSYEPDVELRVIGEAAPVLGLADSYRGHDGVRRLLHDYNEDMDLRWEIEQLVDLGDCVAVRAVSTGRGRSSGVETTGRPGFVYHLSERGKVAWQEIYWDQSEATAALNELDGRTPPVVAQRVEAPRVRRHRTLDERLMFGFPRIYRWLGALTPLFGPRSPVRQAIVRHQTLSGWAATNRDDFELMLVRYAPDVVYEFNPELVTLGLPPRVEGCAAFLKELREFRTAWAEWRFELSFILDLGTTMITLGRASYRGGLSGADVEIEYAQVMDFRGALVSQERDFTDWSEALGSVGLDPEVLSRLKKLPVGAAAEI